jgi:branched-chain amino acid transport system ATP-binding protein
VVLRGDDVTVVSAAGRAQRGLGRSFQDSRLFSGLTVRESLAVAFERFIDVGDPVNAVLRLPALERTEAAVEARVGELIEVFGLAPHADKFVRELSTGTRRLVDLAGVMAHRPSVVLLDEPTSGIAQREVEAMGTLLRRVQQQLHATLVVVEHDMAFIGGLAHRLVALDQGMVLAVGTPTEVLGHGDVVSAFLGGDPLVRSGATAPAGPDGGGVGPGAAAPAAPGGPDGGGDHR